MASTSLSQQLDHKQSPIRVVLLGGGTWAKKYFDAISDNETNFQLVGGVTQNDNVAWRNKAPLFQAMEDLIKNVHFDAAICATNPMRQYDHVHKLERLNIPMILEKPLVSFDEGLTSFELQEQVSFLSETKSIVNHFQMFSPNFQKYRDLIKTSDIQKIEIFEGGPGPIRTFSPALDWGSHAVVIMLLLCESTPTQTFFEKELSQDKRQANLHTRYQAPSEKPKKNKIQFDLFFGNNFREKTRLIKAYGSGDMIIEYNTNTNTINHSHQTEFKVPHSVTEHDIFRAVLSELNNFTKSKIATWPHKSLIMSIESLKLLFEIEKHT